MFVLVRFCSCCVRFVFVVVVVFVFVFVFVVAFHQFFVFSLFCFVVFCLWHVCVCVLCRFVVLFVPSFVFRFPCLLFTNGPEADAV